MAQPSCVGPAFDRHSNGRVFSKLFAQEINEPARAAEMSELRNEDNKKEVING